MDSPDTLSVVGRACDQLDNLLRSVVEPSARAQGLAELLHESWPGADLHACLLEREGDRRLVVLNGAGNP